MEQDYENKRNRFEIKKGHEIQVVVKATSSDLHQNGGGILLAKTSNSFTSMHAVIKAIYEALPDYKGKRIWVEVKNKTTGKYDFRSSHYISKNRIPLTL